MNENYMINEFINPRDFGRLEAEVSSLNELVRTQNITITIIAARLDAMNTTLIEAKGGWKTLMFIGGAAASLGAFFPWLIAHWKS